MTDEKATEAALIVTRAAAAAAGVTKEAEHVAAAVIEVATQAHESLAPSVLVASMFTTIQRQMEQMGRLIEKLDRRLDAGYMQVAEVKVTGEKTYEQAQRTNGRMTEAEAGIRSSNEWHAAHDKRIADAALTESGRHEIVGIPRETVEAGKTFFEEIWPIIVAIVITGAVAVTGTVTFFFGWWTR